MIPLSAQTRVYLAKDPTDMRRSFRGLIAQTEAVLRQEPLTGHLFVFLNRRRDLMKILYWDGSGFCIWYKRLERGTFQRPLVAIEDERGGAELTATQLALMLQGIDLTSARQRLRYRHAATASPRDRGTGS